MKGGVEDKGLRVSQPGLMGLNVSVPSTCQPRIVQWSAIPAGDKSSNGDIGFVTHLEDLLTAAAIMFAVCNGQQRISLLAVQYWLTVSTHSTQNYKYSRLKIRDSL